MIPDILLRVLHNDLLPFAFLFAAFIKIGSDEVQLVIDDRLNPFPISAKHKTIKAHLLITKNAEFICENEILFPSEQSVEITSSCYYFHD